MCLATNMFFEARGEDLAGKFAVGLVTLNRVESKKYPDNVCDVVWQKKQFSWTHDGKHDDPTRFKSEVDKKAWEESKELANALLKNKPQPVLEGSTMYHSLKVSPYWAKHYEPVAIVGNHIFYKDK